ncbi:Fanconi anemia group E protein-like [Lytechinus variegatus]|uniref:Fanconi anemia group E protein-like n=1 Tax=Lytechinus variegatus TaxID=7654 RepID=UPI001BB1FFE4|nr:Fanconi anemia group E protein-like [Lytechinus variegatus]
MNSRDVLQFFPAIWQDLLTSEQPDFNSCSAEGMERLLQKMGGSFHGDRTLFPSTGSSRIQKTPDWFGLLSTLVAKDDRMKDGLSSSEGSARFFQLSVHLQRTLLAVISHHAAEMPLPLLQKLMRCILDDQPKDHWMMFHLHELQNHIATCLPNSQSQRSKVTPVSTGFLTQQSKGLFRKVCESVAATENRQGKPTVSSENVGNPSCTVQASNGFQSFVEYFRESQRAIEIQTKVKDKLMDWDFPQGTSRPEDSFHQNPVKHAFDNQDQSELILQKPKRMKQGSDDEGIVQPPPVLDDQALDRLVEESENEEGGKEHCMKSSNGSGHVDDVIKAEEETLVAGDVIERDHFIEELKSDIKMKIDALKSAWHSIGCTGNTEVCNEAIRFMSTCTSDQLSKLCFYLDVTTIDVSTLPAVCQSITPMADLFSYTATGILAKNLFLDKMTSLTQRPPRALNSALVCFTQAFPKPAIEGALAPCIQSDASSIQFDLVSKVAKEALTNDHKVFLVRSLLGSPGLVWSEEVTGFVQNMLDMKLDMDSSLLGLLCTSLGQNGITQSKCKKFAKLLLAVINKYSKQITPDHVTHLQRSVEVNQTFLKKACQGALKKIKN